MAGSVILSLFFIARILMQTNLTDNDSIILKLHHNYVSFGNEIFRVETELHPFQGHFITDWSTYPESVVLSYMGFQTEIMHQFLPFQSQVGYGLCACAVSDISTFNVSLSFGLSTFLLLLKHINIAFNIGQSYETDYKKGLEKGIKFLARSEREQGGIAEFGLKQGNGFETSSSQVY